MKTLPLNGIWQLSGRRETEYAPLPAFDRSEFSIPAEVPGNIELALFHAGRVPEPFFGRNAKMLRSYEFYEFLYEREFDCDSPELRRELRFDGIDCFGAVFLNDTELGRSENALIPHRFPVPAGVLKPGKNRIAVHIASANRRLESYPLDASAFSAYPFNYESLRIRKPAHAWGWDIAPRLALGGLFRGVELVEIAGHRLLEGFLQTLKLSPDRAQLSYSYRIATTALGDETLKMVIEGVSGDSRFRAEQAVWSSHGAIPVSVKNPRLWNPRHYGEPNLYRVTVTLFRGDEALFSEEFTAGIRTVRLDRRPVATDSAAPDFQFAVNGRPVRTFGSNHVPADALHSRAPERLQAILDLACELECNIIRVWGGGIYETRDFYDRCDREGILVWQDFMMGCAAYPNDAAFRETIRQEAECAVKLLRQHPSVILWAGDNECDLVPGWGGLPLDPNDNKLTRELLPEVCRINDPCRPYLPSSPYLSPEAMAEAKATGNSPSSRCPEQHLWGPRDYFKSDFYRNTRASFLSETGYHGAPNAASIRRFLPKESLWPYHGNPDWYYHASNPFYPDSPCQNFRIDIMGEQIREFFGFHPDDLETFTLASQICQMEAIKYLLELFRSNPKRSGMIWWNLSDCWPQFSDAVTDYYGGRKLACPIIRRLQQPLLVMVSEAKAWERKIVVANDSAEDVRGEYLVRDAVTGEPFATGTFHASAGSIVEPEAIRVYGTEQKLLLIEWTLENGVRGCNHCLTGFPVFDFETYRRNYLPAIAAQDNSFDPEQVGR